MNSSPFFEADEVVNGVDDARQVSAKQRLSTHESGFLQWNGSSIVKLPKLFQVFSLLAAGIHKPDEKKRAC